VTNLRSTPAFHAFLAAAGTAILACLPLLTEGYYLSLGVNIMLYIVLCTAWAMFSGPTHFVSLATAAFFGLGTYSVAVGIDTLPFPILLIGGAVSTALLAGLVGAATLRLSGVYFVIFTLGLAEFIRQVVNWIQTKIAASVGLYVFTDFTEAHIYWMLLALAVVVFLTSWAINRSRHGFALRIIGDDEAVARHVGIATSRLKIILFTLSGAFIGIAGAIVAPRYSYIEPQSAFNPMISFLVVIMALLGGTRRLWGPLIGVVPFTILMDFVSAHFPDQTPVIIGIAFLAIVYALPDGLTSRLEQLLNKFRNHNGGATGVAQPTGAEELA
jgi:branched-chain amino acid transport system permease protein